MKPLLVLVVAALALPAGAAADRHEVDFYLNAKLTGSNDQPIRISGYEDSVTVDAHATGGGAYYVADGEATRRRVQGDFDARGSVDLRFEPRGKWQSLHELRGCDGRYERRRGTFTGTVVFVADNGFNSVTADHAAGSVVANGLDCVPTLPPPNAPWATERTMILGANTPRGRISFEAQRRRGSDHSEFYAGAYERDAGVAIYHYVDARGPAGAFRFDSGRQTATVQPPAPFSGSASYDGEAGREQRWTGDLAATFPGAGLVSLTGPQFSAFLEPAVVYGPSR